MAGALSPTGGPVAQGRLLALALVAPLALFILVTFALPILSVLTRAVHQPEFGRILPQTAAALADWTPGTVPGEPVFAALAADLADARAKGTLGRAAGRLNYELPGGRSLLMQSGQAAAGLAPPYREALLAVDPRWGDPAIWGALSVVAAPVSPVHLLGAFDLRLDREAGVVAKPPETQLYVALFLRTLLIAGAVTLACLVLGYPLAYVLAHLPQRTANLLLILVLLPFWTSLLVRTTSWIVLLQERGVIPSALVALGLVADDARPQLVYNMTGTLVAMTHILLPFMVLPLYSVMRGIPPVLTRAALSLGAGPLTAFVRVYLPLSLPGVGAGGLLVFILALGYYITPELVGGQSGQLISNQIALHMQSTLNWGLAAALSAVLLVCVLVLYGVYARLVGPVQLRLG